MLNTLDKIIQGLKHIKDKIILDQHLENEDWINVASALRSNVNLFINSKHLEKNEQLRRRIYRGFQ